MRLNPTKCTFEVAAGKFLGFMVHKRGTEANSKKIKAILDLESSTNLKQAQRLTARLYLAVSEIATSGALVKECNDGVERPVCYLSRAITKLEKNYTLLEKFAYALVTAARKLQPYFQAHTITVVTD
ncbi:hypothetical protein QYF36_013881 [Acer negundo]|nr:hypothetical protein QYF36_013881 [Acer negundo]